MLISESERVFQSLAVLIKKEFLYFSLMQEGMWKVMVLLMACLCRIFVSWKSLFVFNFILLFLWSAGVKKFMGGIAGT